MARENFFQRIVRGVQRFFGGGSSTPPPPSELEEVPVSPQAPSPPPQEEIVLQPITPPPTIERESDNVFYFSGHTNEKGPDTLPYWQAGSDMAIVEKQDIEDLLDKVPAQDYYRLVVHGNLKSEYPNKNTGDDYLSYKVPRELLEYALYEDESVIDATDVINSIESHMGVEWTEVYQVSIVDQRGQL